MIPYSQLKARIARDKEKKEKRRELLHEQYDNIGRVFTYRHYVRCLHKCRKGVNFKLSVQRYSSKPLFVMLDDCESMLDAHAPAITSSKKVIIYERGNERIITPIVMRDRMNQRVLCDESLVPMISRRLIYDNGASMKNKGVQFARDRFNHMLEKAKRKWHDNFYVLTFDFQRFFDSIPHMLCYEELNKTLYDKRIVDLTMQVIEGYQMKDALDAGDTEKVELLKRHEGVGVCLGSHVSQIMALCVPNFLDHFIKDVKRVKYYIRYMDDGIILHDSRVFLEGLLAEMRALCEQHGMKLKPNKTRIGHIRHGIDFLKMRYRISNMQTVRRLCRATIVRMRRRLKKFIRLVAKGKMTLDMVRISLQSWIGHTLHAMAFRQRRRMIILYETLFGRTAERRWQTA